jgi:hypothetical protein
MNKLDLERRTFLSLFLFFSHLRQKTPAYSAKRLLVSGLALGTVFLSLVPMSQAISSLPLRSVQLPTIADPLRGMLLPRNRTWRSLNQIYEFDRAPLGNRIPVIVLPGRAEEFQQNSWWKGLHRTSQRNPVFQKRFKMYVFLYNSQEELDVQAQGLATDLKKRFGRLPDTQPLMFVTYSLGGVIAREVLADSEMLRRVDTLIAIAVPFHGSPIFDPDWFSDYLNPPNRSPIRRFWDRTIYRGYMFSKSNLTRGLKWDNFDSSKPQFDVNSSTLAGDQVHSAVPPFQEYPNAGAIRQKMIVYGSYLENGYTQTHQPFNPLRLPNYVLGNSLALPKEVVASILPFYGFSVHSVFTYMNLQMANIPTYTPEDPQGRNTHLYRFNDGAIPLSSILFLKASSEPYNDDLDSLVHAATVRKVRLFVNLDHTHLGEYTVFKRTLNRPDLLHEAEGNHEPNEWIIYDLLQRFNEMTPTLSH